MNLIYGSALCCTATFPPCKDILASHFTAVLSEKDWHKNQQKVINEEELKFCAGIYFFPANLSLLNAHLTKTAGRVAVMLSRNRMKDLKRLNFWGDNWVLKSR